MDGISLTALCSNHRWSNWVSPRDSHLPGCYCRESAIKSLKVAANKIKNGVSVLIFPEGTRSRDGDILPFKKGGFVLAIDSGVPIVPVVITGTRSIMTKGKFRVNEGQVNMVIHKPIDTSAYTRDTKAALMENVRRVIVDDFTN